MYVYFVTKLTLKNYKKMNFFFFLITQRDVLLLLEVLCEMLVIRVIRFIIYLFIKF